MDVWVLLPPHSFGRGPPPSLCGCGPHLRALVLRPAPSVDVDFGPPFPRKREDSGKDETRRTEREEEGTKGRKREEGKRSGRSKGRKKK